MLDPEELGHAGVMSNSLNNEVAVCLFSTALSFTVVRIVHRPLLRLASRVGCQHKPKKEIETASRRTFSPFVLSKSTGLPLSSHASFFCGEIRSTLQN